MFAFIENLFLKNKARKILSYIEGIEEELTLFDSIILLSMSFKIYRKVEQNFYKN